MNTYIICYDLNSPGQNYEGLIDAIKEIANGWWHHLDSTWIINNNGPATSIRDYLTAHLDRNDELLVAKLSGESAWEVALMTKAPAG